MAYAEVAVNSPGTSRGTFSYAVPPSLPVVQGHCVWVPFGHRRCLGVVFAITPQPSFTPVRDIESLALLEPVLSSVQVELAQWLASTYFCSSFEAAALMLPPGFSQQPRVRYRCVAGAEEATASPAGPEEGRLWAWLQGHGAASAAQVVRKFGKTRGQSLLSSLERKGLVVRQVSWPAPRTAPRGQQYLRLAVPPESAQEEAQRRERRAPRQAALLHLLTGLDRLPLVEGRRYGGEAAIASLERQGLLTRETVARSVEPLAGLSADPSPRPKLTGPQQACVEELRVALRSGKGGVFLLYGVTGSGKTEVYLRAVEQAQALGKRAIVLVPEISLTPQTLSRFMGRFPGQVAVMHSGLTSAERLDQWHRVSQGEYLVVVGSRGAVFAPQPDLGLIVMDEEHEWTYKQGEASPRYHARDVALKLNNLAGVGVVLGSATPALESYFRAQGGQYSLLQLPGRISPKGRPIPLPAVSVVDMREEWKAENRSLFSRELCQALDRALSAGEQAILFLNRRGSATAVQCPACGFVMRCRRCALPLTYHEAAGALVCHQCNSRSPVPARCPQCGQGGFRFLGAGTQRVEADASAQFPGARLLRWDLDTARGQRQHQQVLQRFLDHQADILVGTQMVAKGLDLPLVSVVGVISADTQLHVPDFRSAERTFQLLSQVAGRAGRGDRPGQVVVQTFSPEHYAIQAAAQHDYRGLYEREVTFRASYNYPPFSRLVRLLHADPSPYRCLQHAQRLATSLRTTQRKLGLPVEVLGPAPAYPPRARGRYRWHVLLRGVSPGTLLAQVPLPPGWAVDVDTVSLA
ncbi:MAG: primosomal protein N' [Chloroflexi bacterium]|nr:primosomal protein N' [Chloroflexota bacterium]